MNNQDQDEPPPPEKQNVKEKKKSTLTDKQRQRWEGEDLLSTFMVRTGLAEPEEIERHGRQSRPRRRRLRTPTDVIRAIGDVVAQLEAQEIEPPAARARLYALQTLLVAMRMNNEADFQPGEPLQLRAAAEPTTDELKHELLHLQHLTAEDPDSKGATR